MISFPRVFQFFGFHSMSGDRGVILGDFDLQHFFSFSYTLLYLAGKIQALKCFTAVISHSFLFKKIGNLSLFYQISLTSSAEGLISVYCFPLFRGHHLLCRGRHEMLLKDDACARLLKEISSTEIWKCEIAGNKTLMILKCYFE